MTEIHLTAKELADRWNIKPETLSQWRWSGRGPYFSKTSGHIKYLLSDVEQFEKCKRCRSTSEYNANKLKYYDLLGSKKDDEKSRCEG